MPHPAVSSGFASRHEEPNSVKWSSGFALFTITGPSLVSLIISKEVRARKKKHQIFLLLLWQCWTNTPARLPSFPSAVHTYLFMFSVCVCAAFVLTYMCTYMCGRCGKYPSSIICIHQLRLKKKTVTSLYQYANCICDNKQMNKRGRGSTSVN